MKPNVFVEQPEFVQDDPRANWHASAGYNLDPEFMALRHSFLLPRSIVDNKSVLDLGCCNAASGAWCLSRGASFYRGVELQPEFAESAAKCLAKYYPKDRWDIRQASIEDYLASTGESFDVVFAAGVLYGLDDPVSILRALAKIARVIVIESIHPKSILGARYLNDKLRKSVLKSREFLAFIENEPFISVGRQGMVVPGDKLMLFDGTCPSMGAVKHILTRAGFRYMDEMNRRMKKAIPQKYSPTQRFALLFVRDDAAVAEDAGFRATLAGAPDRRKVLDWSVAGLSKQARPTGSVEE